MAGQHTTHATRLKVTTLTQEQLTSFILNLPPREGNQVRGDDPDILLTGWRLIAQVIFTNGLNNRGCVTLANPKTSEAKTSPDDMFWEEQWDGTVAHIQDLHKRMQGEAAAFIGQPQLSLAGTMIPAGGMGYRVISLERLWETEAGYMEPANMVAVVPALVERIDRTDSEGNINAGYLDWMDALDQARAGQGGE